MTELTSENFKSEVENYAGKVLVDFWAPWCGPCRAQTPILESLSEEVPEVKVCKVNTDEQEELAARFGIMSIPTLIVFDNGTLKTKAVGLHSLPDLKNLLA